MIERIQRQREREKAATTGGSPRCRYMRLSGEMCTGEALDPQADIAICAKHLAAAMQVVQAGLARR